MSNKNKVLQVFINKKIMRGYFGLGQLSAAEKSDILNQHKSLYNGYQTMQPQVSNTQPLTVYDFAGDKEGLVVNNKGEVKKYTNMGINEQVDTKEVCDECGSMIMDGVCECNYGHMEEDDTEMCECGGEMYEGVCNECGYGHMEEETGHLDDIYHEEDLDPSGGFDYIEGPSNDVDTFEGMHKKLYENKKIEDSDLKEKIKKFIIRYSKIKDIETIIDDFSDEDLIKKIKGFAHAIGKHTKGTPNHYAGELFKELKKSRKETKEDDDFEDYESSYTEYGIDDPNNEDDGFEDINSSEVTDEIEEQGGNTDDMDVSDVEPAYDFESNGPFDGYPVNELEEDDMYGYDPEKMYEYETMESAWADDDVEEEMDEQDVSGVQGVYGDMERPYEFDSNGPGIAGPYQHSSWGGGSKHSPKREEEFEEVDEDLKESFLTQKNKITEMFNRMNRFN